MRFAVAALCVLALTAPTIGADTCRGYPMPPLSKQRPPIVFFEQFLVSKAYIVRQCGAPLHPVPAGCAFSKPTADHPDRWVILLRNDLKNPEDYNCIVKYERSHLPPNNWLDPVVETTPQPFRP